MIYKTIRISADRFAALKAAKEAAGCKTMVQYLERLVASSHVVAGVTEAQVEEEVERRLKARLTEPEVARLIDAEVNRIVEERRTTGSTPTPPVLEESARAVLNMLPDATRDFAYEICESVLHIQPSQLIYGHLMAAADAGRLQAPQIDPSWETRLAQEAAGSSLCEWRECHQPFTPARYGQRFCSNLCGGKAATATLPQPIHKTRPILEAPGMQGLIAV